LLSQVQAQSQLLQQLAEQLALAVSDFSQAAAVNTPGNRVAPLAPRKPHLELPPPRPAVEAAEVYRF
jgi:hypothetical protein